MRTLRALVLSVLTALVAGLLAALVPTAAQAHEERPAIFPDGSGSVPAFLGLDNQRRRVVCKPDSRERIQDMEPGPLKRRNLALLGECEFSSIQGRQSNPSAVWRMVPR